MSKNIQIVDHADSGGDKEKCHIRQKKIRFFLDMVYFQYAGDQTEKKKDHPNDTCRKGKRQQCFDHCADPANGKDNTDLFYNFNKYSLSFSVSADVFTLPQYCFSIIRDKNSDDKTKV